MGQSAGARSQNLAPVLEPTMMTRIRKHWRAISTGMLVASLLGVGAFEANRYVNGSDCCHPGAACCHPGAACCNGHHGAVATR